MFLGEIQLPFLCTVPCCTFSTLRFSSNSFTKEHLKEEALGSGFTNL